MKCTFLLFIFSFISFSAVAHSVCINKNRSCLQVDNAANLDVYLNCTDTYHVSVIVRMKPDQRYTYQFNLSWGDGLGYPSPGVKTYCYANFLLPDSIDPFLISNIKFRINFDYESIDWGNLVEMKLMPTQIKVNLKSRSFPQLDKEYVFDNLEFSQK